MPDAADARLITAILQVCLKGLQGPQSLEDVVKCAAWASGEITAIFVATGASVDDVQQAVLESWRVGFRDGLERAKKEAGNDA